MGVPHGSFSELQLAENLSMVSATVIGLILFSLLFERYASSIHAHGDKVSKSAFSHILEELSILGIISFVLFGIEYWGRVKFPKSALAYFEFLHFELFATTVCYVIVVYVLGLERLVHVKRWKRFDEIILSLRKNDEVLIIETQGFLARLEKKEFERYLQIRNHFIKFHGLDDSFAFSEYQKHCLNYLFLKVIHANWRIGAAILLWIIVSYITLPFYFIKSHQASNIYLLWSAILLAYVVALFGVFCSYKIHTLVHVLKHDGILSHSKDITYPNQVSRDHTDSYRDLLLNINKRSARKQWCPVLYEHDPYRRRFPFAIPNFFTRYIQFAMIYQVLYLTLFIFLFQEILDEEAASIAFSIGFIPPIYVLFVLAPGYLPLVSLIRFTGPLTKHKILDQVRQHGHLPEMHEHSESHSEIF